MEVQDILDRFETHAVSEEAGQRMEEVRISFQVLANHINILQPDGREKSIAMTKLEEAMFWANAGIARTSDEDV